MESFKQDLKRKELMPIKILMFLIYGGQATLYPYFTVHLKSLGVSIKQTAIIFAVQPVIALLVAPAIGMVADKIGNFKFIFSFFLIFSAITANTLLLVPSVALSEKLFYFDVNCDANADLTIKFNKDLSCSVSEGVNNTFANMTVRFECQNSCYYDNNSVLPVLIREEGKHCSKSCNKESKNNQCLYIDESTYLDFTVKVDDLSSSQDTLLTKESYFIGYKNTSYTVLQCSCETCNTSCLLVGQDSVKHCLDPPLPEEIGVTFWTYLGIRLVVTLGIGLVNGLFDAASMTIIQESKADVGFQRFWSTVGMCLFAPISGYLVDTFGNYQPCFLMYGLLYLIAAITSLKLDLSMKIPSENPLKNLAKLLKNPEVILLLMQIAILGICWGFLENYLFWFFESELGSNNLIMGLTVTVGSGTGLFMALISTWCTRKLGYVNVIIVAFAAYTVRFIGYAYAQNAYTCLIFEMMENFTVTLLTVGVTLYCTELASLEMLTTIMTLWNGLHIISGRAFGSLLGGFIVEQHGFRGTFKIFAYISCCSGLFYTFMYLLWLRKWRNAHRKEGLENRRTSTLSVDKEEETMKSEAFSSLSMHCSFDSPAILHYMTEPQEFEFRRRALSHTPVTRTNSLNQAAKIPRHAVSFSGRKKPNIFIVKKNPSDSNELSNVGRLAITEEAINEDKYEESIEISRF